MCTAQVGYDAVISYSWDSYDAHLTLATASHSRSNRFTAGPKLPSSYDQELMFTSASGPRCVTGAGHGQRYRVAGPCSPGWQKPNRLGRIDQYYLSDVMGKALRPTTKALPHFDSTESSIAMTNQHGFVVVFVLLVPFLYQ